MPHGDAQLAVPTISFLCYVNAVPIRRDAKLDLAKRSRVRRLLKTKELGTK
jgi:hypothetical protein